MPGESWVGCCHVGEGAPGTSICCALTGVRWPGQVVAVSVPLLRRTPIAPNHSRVPRVSAERRPSVTKDFFPKITARLIFKIKSSFFSPFLVNGYILSCKCQKCKKIILSYIWNFYSKNNFKIRTCLFIIARISASDSPRVYPNILKTPPPFASRTGIPLVGFATRAWARESATHCLILSQFTNGSVGRREGLMNKQVCILKLFLE